VRLGIVIEEECEHWCANLQQDDNEAVFFASLISGDSSAISFKR
jgi:hypothetical protein